MHRIRQSLLLVCFLGNTDLNKKYTLVAVSELALYSRPAKFAHESSTYLRSILDVARVRTKKAKESQWTVLGQVQY